MRFDIAVDLGSTNISISIFQNKKSIKTATIKNSLGQFGADIITRLAKYNADSKLQKKYQSLLLSDIKYLIGDLDVSSIGKFAIAGNTIMMYFFFGKDATNLGRYPFMGEIDDNDIKFIKDRMLSTIVSVDEVLVPPILGGYVGADMSSVLLSIESFQPKGNYLVVDLGTNAEIALKYEKRFFVASAAAGSAFGYRGSELISKVANKLDSEVVSLDGMIVDQSRCDLNQQQIRNLQMAKSAIYTAINVLLEIASVEAGEIDTIFIAGTFGILVDIEAVKKIKMIPDIGAEIKLVGNASLDGLCNILVSDEIADWSVITKHVVFVELANNESFSVNYIRNMDF